jgi:hypothetical protein
VADLPNGSTFSREPREHTTANLNCPHRGLAAATFC